MSTPAPVPHTDTTHNDGGLALAVAIIGFFIVLTVFTVPYFYDETQGWGWGWQTTARVQPAYTTIVPVVNGTPVAPVAPVGPDAQQLVGAKVVATPGGTVLALDVRPCPNLTQLSGAVRK